MPQKKLQVMNQQACPVNYKRVNVYLIKFYSTIVAALLMMFLLAGWHIPMYVLAVDFGIRVLLGVKYSPLCQLLNFVLKYLQVKPREIDASTKQFAARLGMLFSASIALLIWADHLAAARIVAVIFLVAVMAEVLLDFCIACWLESIWKSYFDQKNATVQEKFFDGS